MGNVQEQQDMKERRKQQNIYESCFEEHQLVFLAPCGCSTICRDCAMRISWAAKNESERQSGRLGVWLYSSHTRARVVRGEEREPAPSEPIKPELKP